MSTFKLQIELGNDAMKTPEDVIGALEAVINCLRTDPDSAHDQQSIEDNNGNCVGQFYLSQV